MDIKQFELILCDHYQNDNWLPPLLKTKYDKFKKSSYSEWAIQELKKYIINSLYPNKTGSINDFMYFVGLFARKMSRYAKINPRNSEIFQTANEVAADVWDLLGAME